MRLAGYQPLTLIDYPGHIAAILFTQGCPFRCTYCHNPELIPTRGETELSEDAVLARLKQDVGMLDGVVVTGGEPTLHPDLPDFLVKLKDLGLHVKLDTNGVNPRLIERCLQRDAVDFFAMDVKHTWENYKRIIGSVPDIAIENCQRTFSMIQECGIDHEFRTTISPTDHTESDILTIASYLQPGESYALQQVRYEKTLMPLSAPADPLDLELLKTKIQQAYPSVKVQIKV